MVSDICQTEYPHQLADKPYYSPIDGGHSRESAYPSMTEEYPPRPDDRSTIAKEFIEGSAIAPDVFRAAVRIVGDIEIDRTTKEFIGTPIADALGWKYTRFGHRANPNRTAALFVDRRGETWQVKIFGETGKGRSGQYLAPKGSGDRAYFPPVPNRIAIEIADRHGVDRPEPGENFWDWFLGHKNIPLSLTEGGKKALAEISALVPAIALYGCRCGANIPELIPYFEGRTIITTFDRDSSPKARSAVAAGTSRLSRAIERAGGFPRVATWDISEGKGIDDVAAACGYDRLREIIDKAIPYRQWRERGTTDLSGLVSRRVNLRFLGAIDIPPTARLIAIKSPKGTGKTQALKAIVRSRPDGIPCYPIGHRVTLQRELCDRLGLPYRTDSGEDAALEKAWMGYGLCVDSLHPGANPPVNPDDRKFDGAWIVVDEVEQAISHLLNSGTCRDKRAAILDAFRRLLRRTIETGGKIFIADADLSRISIELVRALIGEEIETYILENIYRREEKRSLYSLDTPEEAVAVAIARLSAGENIYLATGSQKIDSRFSTRNLESRLRVLFPDLAILRVDQETVSDQTHPAYQCTEVYRGKNGEIERNLTSLIEKYDCVIVSPTLETGVSIDTDHFHAVIGIACGTQTVNGFCQSIERVRSSIPRYIHAPKRHVIGRVGDGSDSPGGLIRGEKKKSAFIFSQLAESDAIADFDGETPIFARTWAKYGAIINAQSEYYRESIVYKLISEGYELISDSPDLGEIAPDAIQTAMTETRDRNWEAEAIEIAAAETPTEPEYKKLKEKKEKTRSERLTERKGKLKDRYLTDGITPEMVRRDDRGWFTQLTLLYFLTTGKPFLIERDRARVKSLGEKSEGRVFAPDVTRRALSPAIAVLEFMGIREMIDFDRVYDSDGLRSWFDRLLPYRGDIKRILGVGFSPDTPPIRLFKSVLKKLGLKLATTGRVGSRGNQSRQFKIVPPDDDRGAIFSRWFERDRYLYLGSREIDIYIDHHPKKLATTAPPDICIEGGDRYETQS